MSTHVIVTRSGLEDSTITLSRAMAIVARAIGDETGPKALAAAKDALHAAAQEWNRRHQFEWTAIDSYTITVTAGTDTYDLPSDFLHEYSLRMMTNERPLRYMRLRTYDRSYWDQDAQSFTSHYTLFGSGTSGQVKLIPIPSESDTLELRYYKGVSVPTEPTQIWGLPDRFVWGIIYKAKGLMLLDKNAEDTRAQYWLEEAERAYRQAREDDIEHPDEDRRLIAHAEHHIRGFPETHPYAGLEYD